ncbi:TATA box-binding protein-associated factor RNA polymerase I subunit B isoform X2 [Syngnathoides biaculeatus]|uniref:TATA box-binding protein-associated factor RNA polymerase I subunit B isoform X2 n=1 Tax=Syngnathoides biaculeatus TaxID=300417 RepID=UPI002ADE0354|nr:TATA box-binding protein-associated factor RNA polymerase I subunit B isoform X2 [Syngnathoides biaculeatus]
MEEELTGNYREACPQCGSVDWGVSDEQRFFCRSCHNVIERTYELESVPYTPGWSQITTISRGIRRKKQEGRRLWVECEGFQFILIKQAAALLELGVAPSFKDDVLRPLWQRFLQMSNQAYTNTPVRSTKFKMQAIDSDVASGTESSFLSTSEMDSETYAPSASASQPDSCSDWSDGSHGSSATLRTRHKSRCRPMRMTKTLALIHLALVWSRQALTLGDLLRLVSDGHVPYITAYQDLPEEMKLNGPKAMIFTVQTVPTHRALHKEAQTLIRFLQLPAFPPIRHQDPLHPKMLSLRYLADANLPDELYPWVCMLMERSSLADPERKTLEASSRRTLPQYDVQAAALIIVAMKLLFGLDDRTEWYLSNATGDLVTEECTSHDQPSQTGSPFSLRRWYRLLHVAMTRAQQRQERVTARKQWKGMPLYSNRKVKSAVLKKQRVAETLKSCLEKLSSCTADAPPAAPSSFTFCWGEEDGADGPSLRDKNLNAVVTLKQEVLSPVNTAYWHIPLNVCDSRNCNGHFAETEATLPRSFLWLLQLFSFILQVKPAQLHQEVLNLERCVLKRTVGKGNLDQKCACGRRRRAAC